MDDCLFCRFVNDPGATQYVYNDEQVIVIKDINPQAPVHLLIIPRQHIRSINDLTVEDNQVLAHTIQVAQNMAKKFGVDQSGYKLLFNVESGGGQVIFHLHLHLFGGWSK